MVCKVTVQNGMIRLPEGLNLPDGAEVELLVPEQTSRSVNTASSHKEGKGTTTRPQFGCMAGKIWMAPDFDDPLDDFKEYMG